MRKPGETPLASAMRKRRPFRIDLDMYITPPVVTTHSAADDQKMKTLLKRAVSREKAPQDLINAIRSGIRN